MEIDELEMRQKQFRFSASAGPMEAVNHSREKRSRYYYKERVGAVMRCELELPKGCSSTRGRPALQLEHVNERRDGTNS